MGPGEALDEVTQRRVDRVGEHRRQSDRDRDAERVAQPGSVIRCCHPRLARSATRVHEDRTLGGDQLVDPPRHLTGETVADPCRDLRLAERPEDAQQVVDLVEVAGGTSGRESLQLELDLRHDVRVEQGPQLLGAEQVTQQLSVERERCGPALRQRRIALVHVDGDPAEQQGAGEGRRGRRLDAHDADPPAADLGQDAPQGREVEHVVAALTSGFEQDREPGVPGRDRQQVRGALALLPQRRAPVGSTSGQQQRPRCRLPEPGGERARRRQDGDHLGLDVVGVTEEQLDGKVIDRLGQAHDDAVVGPQHLEAAAVTDLLGDVALQPRSEHHRPRGVDPRSEGGVDAQAPVPDLVAEPFDDDRSVVGHRAGRLRLLVEVGEHVVRCPLVEEVQGAESFQRLSTRDAPDLTDEPAERAAELGGAARPVAVPERHLAGLTGRRGDDDPFEGDLLDPPCRGPEQEDLADPRLVDHLLVELADPGPLGEEHPVQPAVRDGAARGHREALCSGSAAHRAGPTVPHDTRSQLGELLRRVPSGQHVERRLEHLT